MRCRHCAELIIPSHSQYNHGWRHEGTGDVYCRLTMAQPREVHDD